MSRSVAIFVFAVLAAGNYIIASTNGDNVGRVVFLAAFLILMALAMIARELEN